MNEGAFIMITALYIILAGLITFVSIHYRNKYEEIKIVLEIKDAVNSLPIKDYKPLNNSMYIE